MWGAISVLIFFKIVFVILSHPVEFELLSPLIIFLVWDTDMSGNSKLFLFLGLSFYRISMGSPL